MCSGGKGSDRAQIRRRVLGQLKAAKLAFSLRLDEEKEVRQTLDRLRGQKSVDALAKRAECDIALDDWQAGLEDCRAALAASAPNPTRLYRWQAWCLGNLGRYQEGLEVLGKAGEGPETREIRGYLLVGLGRYPEAIDVYTAAIAGKPTGSAYLGRSLAHQKLKHWREEQADYYKGAQLDPHWYDYPRWP